MPPIALVFRFKLYNAACWIRYRYRDGLVFDLPSGHNQIAVDQLRRKTVFLQFRFLHQLVRQPPQKLCLRPSAIVTAGP